MASDGEAHPVSARSSNVKGLVTALLAIKTGGKQVRPAWSLQSSACWPGLVATPALHASTPACSAVLHRGLRAERADGQVGGRLQVDAVGRLPQLRGGWVGGWGPAAAQRRAPWREPLLPSRPRCSPPPLCRPPSPAQLFTEFSAPRKTSFAVPFALLLDALQGFASGTAAAAELSISYPGPDRMLRLE